MKRVLITAGPAWEPIDDVRRITNFATGEIGAILAGAFVSAGWQVLLLRGETSTAQLPSGAHIEVRHFTGVASVTHEIEQLAGDDSIQAVLHAAALSDFIVASIEDSDGDPVFESKLDSLASGFLLRLIPAPKVLPRLRDWFPHAFIVGWKYEVGGALDEAIAAAKTQITAARSDICVLNGSSYGPGFGIICADSAAPAHHASKPALASALVSLAASRTKNRG